MTFEEKISSDKGDVLSFYFFYFLFLMNEAFFKNKSWRRSLAVLLKCELYYLGGGCKNSGNCCRNLMVYKKDSPINSFEKYEKTLSEDKQFKKFKPDIVYRGTIKSFSCSSLTPSNFCDDYDNRPQFCRNYPYSNFMHFNAIKEGCGYEIRKKNIKVRFNHPKLLPFLQGLPY